MHRAHGAESQSVHESRTCTQDSPNRSLKKIELWTSFFRINAERASFDDKTLRYEFPDLPTTPITQGMPKQGLGIGYTNLFYSEAASGSGVVQVKYRNKYDLYARVVPAGDNMSYQWTYGADAPLEESITVQLVTASGTQKLLKYDAVQEPNTYYWFNAVSSADKPWISGSREKQTGADEYDFKSWIYKPDEKEGKYKPYPIYASKEDYVAQTPLDGISLITTKGQAVVSGYVDEGTYATALWTDGEAHPMRELVSNYEDYEEWLFADVSKDGLFACTAKKKSDGKWHVLALLPMDLTAHKRGTIDAPGAAIPRAGGSEVYEVVTLENADYDETNWQPTSMSDGAQEDKQDGKTDAVSKDKDDDFVKLRFSCPLTNVAGNSEIVFDQAGQGERMQDADIRFYNSAGEQVQRSALKIDDLKSPSGPLAHAFAGGLDLFVEIGDLGKTTTSQGSAESTTRKYADLIWKFTIGGTTIEQKVRIYRGGFWRNDRTGNNGTIALYDGKGEKPDGTIDYGQIVKGPYQIKTGNDNCSDEATPHKGPTPMGWYGLWDRNPSDGNAGMRTNWDGSSRPQTNHHRNADGLSLGFVQQGSYCQWAQPGNHEIPGKGPFGYDNAKNNDPYQGMPASIHFKFELSPIGNFTTRTYLQIHPDGFNEGTAGCVGIQNYDDCCKVLYLVRHYFQTRLLVD